MSVETGSIIDRRGAKVTANITNMPSPIPPPYHHHATTTMPPCHYQCTLPAVLRSTHQHDLLIQVPHASATGLHDRPCVVWAGRVDVGSGMCAACFVYCVVVCVCERERGAILRCCDVCSRSRGVVLPPCAHSSLSYRHPLGIAAPSTSSQSAAGLLRSVGLGGEWMVMEGFQMGHNTLALCELPWDLS